MVANQTIQDIKSKKTVIIPAEKIPMYIIPIFLLFFFIVADEGLLSQCPMLVIVI